MLADSLDYVTQVVIPAAYDCLPESMASKEATALLIAVGLQESRFQYRRQMGGPARGFWQFEAMGGCAEVLTHPACRGHMAAVLALLQYPATTTATELHSAIEHNDVLAAVCARLLLWTIPDPLPGLTAMPSVSWDQYLRTWRPGRPHRSTWDAHHSVGITLV